MFKLCYSCMVSNIGENVHLRVITIKSPWQEALLGRGEHRAYE